jgi:DNA-directed RNA polymerase specialized sigma24 family protein
MPDPAPILLPETAAMKRALSRLRFLDREVILLKARDGLTYQQIGALLGLSPAATERRFASALVKLRIALEPRRRSRWRR